MRGFFLLTVAAAASEWDSAETFLLFSRDIPSQDLGFVDARAAALGLAVAGREYTIHQSPTLLSVFFPHAPV